MTDNGCKREMTFEEERLAYTARLKELLFAEDEYPGDSLLKCVLRDSQRILGKASAKIEALQMENKQLQSDVITTNQYYEHTKEQLEKAIKISQRSNQRFIEAKKELEETQEKLECLLCHATGSKLSKSTYPLGTMESAVTDYIEDCCNEAEAEAVKEFAERFENEFPKLEEIYLEKYDEHFVSEDDVIKLLCNLVKEKIGES